MPPRAYSASRAIASALVVLASCREHRGAADAVDASPPASVSERDTLRDESRLIFERRSGSCHIPDSPTALPRALAVFDLREIEWSARMTNAQLSGAIWRLNEPLPPDGTSNDVSDAERAQFKLFVDAEVARRAVQDGGRGR